MDARGRNCPSSVKAGVVTMTGGIHDRPAGSTPTPTTGFWNFFLGCVGFLEKCYSEETPGGTQDDIHW